MTVAKNSKIEWQHCSTVTLHVRNFSEDFLQTYLDQISLETLLSVGCYVPALTDLCIEASKKIGKFSVDMGGTACKIPAVPEYVQKVKERGNYGKKKTTARC